MRKTSLLVSLLASAAFLAGCNEVPVKNLITSYSVQVQDFKDKSNPSKIDILWVVDDSPSMCQEQQSLADSFFVFMNILNKYAAIDARIAVTTSDMCPKANNGNRGKFVYQPAKSFPPSCFEKRALMCTSDSHCNNALGGSTWRCKMPTQAKFIYSCDCPKDFADCPKPQTGDPKLIVINSECTFGCSKEDPTQCVYKFGKPSGCDKTCEGGSCSVEKCDANFHDPAGCDAACNGDLNCQEKCALSYIEGSKCADVCDEASQAECEAKCVATKFGDNFDTLGGDPFSCSMMCSSYSCVDQCITLFGKPQYRCVWPGSDQSQSGCLRPPPTRYCPKVGPKVLDMSVAEEYYKQWKDGNWKGIPDLAGLTEDEAKKKIFEFLFSCMASVGAVQNICSNQEQPLRAAWHALDSSGENADQAKAFLRPDAYLLIIFVGDEDDCSSDEGTVSADNQGRCTCLCDEDLCDIFGRCSSETGRNCDLPGVGKKVGPLHTIYSYVNKFKSLKKDPAMVLVASITGDVQPKTNTTPGDDTDAARKRYQQCKCDATNPYAASTYSCLSKQGKADLGMRLMKFVESFGAGYGQTSNICSDTGFEDALENIAGIIIPHLQIICLPRPMDKSEYIKVWKVFPDKSKKLLTIKTEGASGYDYELMQNAVNCASYGLHNPNAVIFSKPLEPSDSIEIVYQAEPFYQP
ncbi:MAG: hypothetical protein FJ088_04985 [Deltaproteobacteria bacterium]|nr:hypothetical protein [Deltaproteobacteria bacterium]